MSELRRERYGLGSGTTVRTISWGAVVAGVLLAIALQLMLGLLGLGIGLGSVSSATDSASSLASAAGIWSVVVALIGLFVGAFSAARLSGAAEKIEAVLHGVVTWASATLLVVVLLGSTASAVLGGAFGAIGSSIDSLTRAAASVAAAGGDIALPQIVRGDLDTLSARRPATAAPVADGQESGAAEEGQPAEPAAAGTSDPQAALAAVAEGLSETASEDARQAAVTAIAELGGLTPAAAQQKLADYQRSYDEALRQARQAADRAARSVAAASFSAFVALLLGLVVGALGGFLGRAKTVQGGRSFRE